jgi:hypothetical protein
MSTLLRKQSRSRKQRRVVGLKKRRERQLALISAEFYSGEKYLGGFDIGRDFLPPVMSRMTME